ncbi:MAG: hypothetical protein ACLFP2_05150 [Candidatus Woesearchaeota archaeon]
MVRKLLLLAFLLTILGCTYQTIDEIKDKDNIGENVAVRGEVLHSVKIGDMSGYVIKDKNNDTIEVTSDDLPDEGETIVARGTLERNMIFGYYIMI